MNLAELYEVYYMAQEAVDRLLQFQISISFAVVIAAFLASNRLNGFFYLIIGVSFSLVYLILAFRMDAAIKKLIEFEDMLKEFGEIFPEYPLLVQVSVLTEFLIYASVTSFLYYWYRRGEVT